MTHQIDMILAIGEDGSLGFKNSLPWTHNAEDMRHFRVKTVGKTVVMGRATWESIGNRPLPSRRNVVVSRTLLVNDPEVEVVGDIDDIDFDCVIIGGLTLYEQFRERATNIWLTVIDGKYEHDVSIYQKDFLKGFSKISEKRCRDCTFFHYKKISS